MNEMLLHELAAALACDWLGPSVQKYYLSILTPKIVLEMKLTDEEIEHLTGIKGLFYQ